MFDKVSAMARLVLLVPRLFLVLGESLGHAPDPKVVITTITITGATGPIQGGARLRAWLPLLQ